MELAECLLTQAPNRLLLVVSTAPPMVRALTAFAFVASVFLAQLASAHPGVKEDWDLAKRSEFLQRSARSLANCENSPEYIATREAAIKRRSELLGRLRQEAEAKARRAVSTSTVLATSHKSSLTGVTLNTPNSTLFGSSVQCILSPETTQGPYFVSGEPIRNNIADSQTGLPLYVDLQFVDVNTCTVVPSLYVNFWHCNSTGVYSGIVASGNGNTADTSNKYKTFNRGLFPTDSNGVVQFTTTFPGHYTSRATHIHLVTAYGGTVLANNTYTNAKFSHVGQLFFDQTLITAVEALSPYSTNKQPVTLNSADSVLGTAIGTTYDPVLNYAYISDSISNGVLAWISVGVDMTKSFTVTPAAYYTSS